MRTRAADDFEAIKRRLDEMRPKKEEPAPVQTTRAPGACSVCGILLCYHITACQPVTFADPLIWVES